MRQAEVLSKMLRTAAIGLTAVTMVAAEGKTPAQANTGKLDNQVGGPVNRNVLVVNSNPDTNNTDSQSIQNPETTLNPDSLQDGQMYYIQITQDPTDGLVYSGKEDPAALQKAIAKLKVGEEIIGMYIMSDGSFLVSGGAMGGIENGTPTIYIKGDYVTPVEEVVSQTR